MKYAVILLLFLGSVTVANEKLVNGHAEWCALSPKEIMCVDHTLNQCLRTISLIRDGYVCERNVWL